MYTKITRDELNEYLDSEYSTSKIAEKEAIATTLGYRALDIHYNKILLFHSIKKNIHSSFEQGKRIKIGGGTKQAICYLMYYNL